MRVYFFLLGCVVLFAGVGTARNGISEGEGKETLKKRSSFSMPAYFLSNMGRSKAGKPLVQDDSVVAFAQTERGRVMFTPNGAYFGIQTQGAGVAQNKGKRPGSEESELYRSQITIMHTGFESKAQEVVPVLRKLQSGKVNFFKGKREDWRTGLSMYNELAYEKVWPGIDLVFLGNQNRLEYRLDLESGADPNTIRMETGADRLELDADGNLRAYLDDGVLTITTPYAFQMIHGTEHAVPVSFVPGENGTYGFRLGSYQPGLPLTIDPVLIWSSLLRGAYTGSDKLHVDDVVATPSGHIVLAGLTYTSNFPTTQGAFDTTYNPSSSFFILTFNSSADTILNATFLGAGSPGAKLALGLDGSVYITGYTSSTSFPVTDNAFDTTSNGSYDAFISKFSSNLSQLLYSTYVGGSGSDKGRDIAVFGDFAYITGITEGGSSGFPLQSALDTTDRIDADVFITKVDTSFVDGSPGSSLVFSTFLGGSGEDEGTGIVIASNGDPIICGDTTSTDFPTFNGIDSSLNSTHDIFYARLTSTGQSLNYSSYYGGSDDDNASQIALNADDSFHICGTTWSTDLPMAGAYDATHNGLSDAFIMKVNFLGSTLDYATYYGGSGYDDGNTLSVSSSGNMFLSGESWSEDLPVDGFAGYVSFSLGNGYISKINVDGTTLVYATYLGGIDGDEIKASALLSDGKLWVVGDTSSYDFPVTAGAYQEGIQAVAGGFATLMSVTGNGVLTSTYLSGSGGVDEAYAIAVTPSGKPVILGETNDSSFPTEPGTYQADLKQSTDLFVTKFNLSGSGLLFSTFLGGTSLDIAGDIAIGPDGSIHLTGQTLSPDFPTQNAFQTNKSIWYDAFYAKLSSDGSALLYGTYLGGNGNDDFGTAIAVDSDGYTYVAGVTNSSSYPLSSPFDSQTDGDEAFITKIDSSGGPLIFSSYLGGTGVEHLRDLVVSESFIVLLGDTTASDFPVLNGYDSVHSGGTDLFMCKLPLDGSALTWSTFFGGSLDESAGALAIGADQSVLLAGATASLDLPLQDAYMAGNPSTSDNAVFISRFSSDGSNLLYSTYFGGTDDQSCSGLATDSYGNIYLAGVTGSEDFPSTTGSFGVVANEVYVSKLSPDGQSLLFSDLPAGSGIQHLSDIALSKESFLFITGYTILGGFPATSGSFIEDYVSDDVFVAKYQLGPEILTQPEGGSICVSGGKILTVTASGSGTLSYSWELDGQVLSESSPWAGTQTNTLLIHDAHPIATGSYRCLVSDDNGSLHTDETVVIVNELVVQINGDHAQGWNPVVLEAFPDCDIGTLSYDWENTTASVSFGSGQNPVTLPGILNTTTDFEVVMEDASSGSIATATWRVLVAAHIRFRDLNGDHCNDTDDLHLVLEEWLTESEQDADASGWMDVRDFLYLNLTGCP